MTKSIRLRLTISFLIYTIAPLLITGGLIALYSYTFQRNHAIVHQGDIAEIGATKVSAFLNELESNLKFATQLNDFPRMSSAAATQILHQLQAHQSAFEEISLITASGQEWVRVSYSAVVIESKLRDLSADSAILIPITTGESYYGRVYFHEETGEPFMLLIEPIRNPRTGSVDGVLSATVRLRSIWELVVEMNEANEHNFYIVGRENQVIAHRNPSLVLRGTTFNLPASDGITIGLEGTPVVFGRAEVVLGDITWTVVAESSVKDALNLTIRLVLGILLLLFFAVLTSAHWGYSIMRQIVRPIETLSVAAKQLSAGDFSQRVEIHGENEIASLGNSFNQMAEELSTLFESLEDRVVERTERLQESEEKYRNVIERANEGILIVQNAAIVFVNHRFACMAGYEQAEITGQPFSVVVPPESRPMLTDRYQRRMNGEDVPTIYEVELVRKNGQKFAVEVNAGVIQYDGVAADLVLLRDITERRRSEIALRESEERYRLLADQSVDVIWQLDLRLRFTYVSPAIYPMTGFTQEEWLGTDVSQHAPRKEFWKMARLALGVIKKNKSTEIINFETEMLRKNGDVFPVEISSKLLLNDKGLPIGMQGSIRDISLRRQMLTALRESEERLRLAIAAGNQGLYDINIVTGETNVNDEYALMLGYPPVEFKESNAAWMERLHPNDFEQATKNYHDYISGAISEYRVEFRQRAQSGDWVWILSMGEIVERDADGNPLRLLGTHTDITQRKVAEETLHWRNQYLTALQETTLELLSELELNTLLENIAWRAARLIGTSSGYIDLVDTETGHLVPRIGFGALAESLKFKVQPGEGVAGIVWQTGQPLVVNNYDQWEGRIARFKSQLLYSVIGVPLISDAKVLGVLGLGHEMGIQRTFDQGDVEILTQFASLSAMAIKNARLFSDAQKELTDRVRAEQELARFAEELMRSNSELEQFAYVASHDLQEPLRMVASYLQLVERRYADRLDDTGREFIAFAVDGATRMKRLINDLLAFSRVGTRARPMEKINLQDVMAQVQANLQPLLEDHGGIILLDELPTVLADENQMVQLFQNLVGNAIKFHGEELPRIQIGAATVDGFWKMHVQDNGIGIEPKFKERIFAIFERLHTTQEYAGTGIGLAICKRIVERHGGRIWVESQLGEGATFYFNLPALNEIE